MGGRSIEEAVDYLAIVRVQRHYADIVNRRAWSELAEVFSPTVTIELDLITREPIRLHGLDTFAAFVGPAMAGFAFFEFVILNTHVELWPDDDRTAATARLFMCELRQNEGAAERNDVFGLYRDRYELVDEHWRIVARRYRSMGRFPAGDSFPLPDDLAW